MRHKSTFEGLYPHKQLVVCRDLILALDPIIEVNPGQSTIGVDLHFLTLHKLASKGLVTIILHIEHNLIPPVIQLQRHRAFKRFNPCDRLVIAANEGSLHILVI